MNAPSALLTVVWLARDTLRQALASGVFWVMLMVSLVCIVFCLSVEPIGGVLTPTPGHQLEVLNPNDPVAQDPQRLKESGVEVISGELNLAFGLFRTRIGRDRADAVHHLQLLLAGGVADTLGLFLTLIFTAGFLPTFLEPSAVSVLLAKPVPRWSLLTGKYLGVLAFVLFHATVFVGGTWLALGLRTNIWDASYLLCIPLLLLNFAVFYSFSTFLAVATRSTVACVLGSILFFSMCWGLNYGRDMLALQPDMDAVTPALRGLMETGYWMLPKPADQSLMLFDSLQAGNYFPPVPYHAIKNVPDAFLPEMVVLSSLGFALVMLIASAWQFRTMDY
jgi:ABC-type transport system involved in multi-copper enzyme maturation permease subunit